MCKYVTTPLFLFSPLSLSLCLLLRNYISRYTEVYILYKYIRVFSINIYIYICIYNNYIYIYIYMQHIYIYIYLIIYIYMQHIYIYIYIYYISLWIPRNYMYLRGFMGRFARCEHSNGLSQVPQPGCAGALSLQNGKDKRPARAQLSLTEDPLDGWEASENAVALNRNLQKFSGDSSCFWGYDMIWWNYILTPSGWWRSMVTRYEYIQSKWGFHLQTTVI